jgi:hypothetical protein
MNKAEGESGLIKNLGAFQQIQNRSDKPKTDGNYSLNIKIFSRIGNLLETILTKS